MHRCSLASLADSSRRKSGKGNAERASMERSFYTPYDFVYRTSFNFEWPSLTSGHYAEKQVILMCLQLQVTPRLDIRPPMHGTTYFDQWSLHENGNLQWIPRTILRIETYCWWLLIASAIKWPQLTTGHKAQRRAIISCLHILDFSWTQNLSRSRNF
jgi:hypothetical protein